MIRRKWFWWIGLAAAVSFDYLMWGHPPGISFFIFVVVCLLAGIAATGIEGVKPNWKSAILIPFILASAAITFLRVEPLTVASGGMLTLGLMMILVYSYRGGNWPGYDVVDHILSVFKLGSGSALHPALYPVEKSPAEAAAAKSGWRRWLPAVLRGAVLALPVILVFAALLASADPIFRKLLASIFNLDRLPEYLLRATYILAGMYLLVGVFLYAALSSREKKLLPQGNLPLKPFIGYIEAVVVLSCVSALFAVFVAVQFRYFFGGTQNIAAEGFTYAEYARRGFGELVVVAFFSLLLLLGLTSLTRKESPSQRRIFSALGVLLVAMVVVILFSSFQRLRLYEDAYGFTRLRIYTHVFIIWLGILLVGVAALDLFERVRQFSLAAILVAAGFTFTLALLNVDASIVHWNGSRTREGFALDTDYLQSLSADAVPALLDVYAQSDPASRDLIGANLSCRLVQLEDYGHGAWQSYLAPMEDAIRLIRASTVEEDYPVVERDWEVYVKVGNKEVVCPAVGESG